MKCSISIMELYSALKRRRFLTRAEYGNRNLLRMPHGNELSQKSGAMIPLT